MVKKIVKIFNVGILVAVLLVPLLIFLNRFLIPDVSFDSLNYHLYLGFKGLNSGNNQFEFYPTGIHNFASILDMPGYLLMRILGYRVGAVGSLIFLYLSIYVLYKIFRLYRPTYKVLDSWWWGIAFGSVFISFEVFLQIATYLVDIEVAFWSLWGVYLLLKYELSRRLRTLVISAVVISLVFWGKMTSGYILPGYFLYLVYILISDKKLIWRQKIARLFLAGLVVVSLSIPFWYQNYVKSGNPIFPYYNQIFKSIYFPMANFEQEEAGGTTNLQKIFWGVASIKNYQRLGQVHDLFNDYKINIYYLAAIVIFLWALVKKDKSLIILSAFYWITFEIWGWEFGYLRYGIFLEFLGGIILLIWLTGLKGGKKYLIILPILGIMLLQGKRIVNLSLAYDLSFRPGYFYNHFSYFKELPNINKSMITINQELVKKYQPQVYLNCAIPQMSYLVLSEFSDLPVLSIDQSTYTGMSNNQWYRGKAAEMLKNKVKGDVVNFVTITTEKGLNVNSGGCLNTLKDNNYKVLDSEETSFLGYQGQKLKVIYGQFNW